jgi:hypothetical protein
MVRRNNLTGLSAGGNIKMRLSWTRSAFARLGSRITNLPNSD